jgi:antitoxin VapB
MQTAKLFPNGQSQAVRLPKEFRFAGDRVYICRQGNAVVLLPYHNGWQVLWDSLSLFSSDFAADENPDLMTIYGSGDAA